MKIVALLLVKSDSRRLPNKNIQPFFGKPMFIWNLEKCFDIFDEVCVSSDSDEILNMAQEYTFSHSDKNEMRLIQRPKRLCGDTPNIPVYKHALKEIKSIDKIEPDALVAVQANSPTINPAIILTIKNIMETGEWQEVMTCHKDFSIYGSVWALTADRIKKYGNPYEPTPEALLFDPSVDIHTETDIKKAKNSLVIFL